MYAVILAILLMASKEVEINIIHMVMYKQVFYE